jgi:hypothetical protein
MIIMNNRKIIKNKNAASVPLEFTIAFGIMMIGMTFLLISANQLYKTYDAVDADFMGKSSTLVDVLISNPGFPEDWYDPPEPLPPTPSGEAHEIYITRLGLALDYDSSGILDLEKIQVLSDKQLDYEVAKESLGIEDWYYDFHVEIYYNIDKENPICEYGPEIKGVTRKFFIRNVLIDDGISKENGQIKVTVFF